MHIILEGPDNSGKTTLANHMMGCVKNLIVHHPGGRPAHEEAELACVNEQLQMLKSDCPALVLDRITPISQSVYADDGDNYIRGIRLTRMLNTHPVVVYCRPSNDRLMSFENFTWRAGETEEHKQRIITNQHEYIRRYDTIMGLIPHITYDFDCPTSKHILSKLVSGLQGDPAAMVWYNESLRMKGNR